MVRQTFVCRKDGKRYTYDGISAMFRRYVMSRPSLSLKPAASRATAGLGLNGLGRVRYGNQGCILARREALVVVLLRGQDAAMSGLRQESHRHDRRRTESLGIGRCSRGIATRAVSFVDAIDGVESLSPSDSTASALGDSVDDHWNISNR